MTPRQTCPGRSFGRNLRSKTRWFTGFCNSHQVSHFATFFIDARAKISVAESRFINTGCHIHAPENRARDRHTSVYVPWRIPRRIELFCRKAPKRGLPRLIGTSSTRPEGFVKARPTHEYKHVRWSFCWAGFDNDPSAGSPTETLLRLLLPLNDKVQ